MFDADKDSWEVVNKGCNALVVAQAAGFVACLNLLKDYDPTDAGALRGLPWLILWLGIGLVTAIVRAMPRADRSAAFRTPPSPGSSPHCEPAPRAAAFCLPPWPQRPGSRSACSACPLVALPLALRHHFSPLCIAFQISVVPRTYAPETILASRRSDSLDRCRASSLFRFGSMAGAIHRYRLDAVVSQ